MSFSDAPQKKIINAEEKEFRNLLKRVEIFDKKNELRDSLYDVILFKFVGEQSELKIEDDKFRIIFPPNQTYSSYAMAIGKSKFTIKDFILKQKNQIEIRGGLKYNNSNENFSEAQGRNTLDEKTIYSPQKEHKDQSQRNDANPVEKEYDTIDQNKKAILNFKETTVLFVEKKENEGKSFSQLAKLLDFNSKNRKNIVENNLSTSSDKEPLKQQVKIHI